jgi:hypothetical protein
MHLTWSTLIVKVTVEGGWCVCAIKAASGIAKSAGEAELIRAQNEVRDFVERARHMLEELV